MPDSDIWKYCTAEHCKEFLLSFRLLGDTDWTREKQLACLYAVSNHTEKHYQPVTIKKRDGTPRSLFVPDPLLMNIQANILRNILDLMPVSPFATAYHKGAGIVRNASVHTGQTKILKMDIENFFGRIVFPMVYQNAFPTVYYPPAVGTMLTHLCCYHGYLPQGAPTSAAISNLVMRHFDAYMGKWCAEREIIYTRYCDDMTFSGDFDAGTVESKVRNFLSAMGFAVNGKKTKLLTRQGRQSVTGIVVNEKPQASRQYRSKLRQEIHYCGKYGVVSHLTRINDQRYLPLGQDGIAKYCLSLLGKVNFVLHVNPQDTYFRQAKELVQCLYHKAKQPCE